MRDYTASNGLHPTAWNGNNLEPTTGFDYDAVAEALGEAEEPDNFGSDEQIAWADCVAGWTLLLEWVATPESILVAGARAHLLIHWLTPEACRYKSLQQIADAAGVTRARLSKNLMEFRKQISLHIGLGKREYVNERYSEAQKASYAMGKHSSFTRSDRKSLKS